MAAATRTSRRPEARAALRISRGESGRWCSYRCPERHRTYASAHRRGTKPTPHTPTCGSGSSEKRFTVRTCSRPFGSRTRAASATSASASRLCSSVPSETTRRKERSAKREMLAVAADERRAHAGALQPTSRNDQPSEGDVDADHALAEPAAREHEVGGAAADVEPPATRRRRPPTRARATRPREVPRRRRTA